MIVLKDLLTKAAKVLKATYIFTLFGLRNSIIFRVNRYYSRGNTNFANTMLIEKTIYMLGVFMTLSIGVVRAQLDPTATLILENGMAPEEPFEMSAGDTYTGSAPLEFLFSANMTNEDDSSLRFEWNFSDRADFATSFLTRFDEETSYTFDKAGSYYIRLQVTYMDNETSDVSETFVVQVTESELKVPNAFSPNDDGINDVFHVAYKSLVKFEATVFNRWGRKLYHWNLANIDQGWDGTAHGKQVPDGVYYIVVKAVGADGVVYNHKGDINILR